MLVIILFVVFFHFILCLKRPIYGVGVFISARILIPESARISESISLNTMLIFILALFMVGEIISKKSSLKNKDFSLLKYYLVFSGFAFFCLLFSSFSNFSFQLSALLQFFITNMLPGIIVAYYLRNIKDLEITIKILTISTFICCIWGIITFVMNSNPYLNLFNSFDKLHINVNSSTASSRGFENSTSATFIHSNGFGYFLPITFAFYFFMNKIKPSKIYTLLLSLLFICIVISKKRSALVSFFVFVFAYIIYLPNKKQKIKVLITIFGFFLISFLMMGLVPSLGKASGFIESSLFFWNDKLADQNNIGGSTFAMRLLQWIYPFIEVKDNLLFGKGFGWTTLYLTKNSFHPILYGFETIIAEAVVTMGILGLFIWSWIFWKSYSYSSKNDKEKLYYKLFTITQLAIAIATGFSYFVFFSIFIVLLSKVYLLKELKYDKNISCYGNL